MSLANIKKGDTVVLFGFTGIRLANVVVESATKTELKVEKKDGKILIFDRKTGIQKNVDEGKEKYANKIVSEEDAPAPKAKKAEKPVKKEAKPKAEKKPAKKAKKEVVEEDEDEDIEIDEDDEDFEEM